MRASLLLLLLVALLAARPVAADLFTAQLAYQKGDYDRAAKDYRELAELGQPVAQYNLAIMYAKGQGVRQSELNAYAWATLAAENGYPQAASLVEQLRPQLAPGSEKIADAIRAPYMRTALDARLMPKIEENPVLEARCRAHSDQARLKDLEYPPEARAKGMQGEVVIQFTRMPDGSSRNPRVIYAVPSGYFERAAREDVLRFRAQEDPTAAPAECQVMYRFVLGGGDFGGVARYAQKVRTEAEAGTPGAQFTYGLLLANFPRETGAKSTDAVPWFLKAAQQGSRDAQFALGNSLLRGWGCQCDARKGDEWLRQAAEADQAAAQVSLATYALRDNPDEARTRLAAVWLERAAAHGSPEGIFFLSALLAATPVTDLRNPTRALELAGKAEKDFPGNPSLFEIQAAAAAAKGNFPQAIRYEEHAVGVAKSLSWDTAPLQERLGRYQSSQPWYGNLLTL